VPDNISMVCYTESRVGTTAGREIRGSHSALNPCPRLVPATTRSRRPASGSSFPWRVPSRHKNALHRPPNRSALTQFRPVGRATIAFFAHPCDPELPAPATVGHFSIPLFRLLKIAVGWTEFPCPGPRPGGSRGRRSMGKSNGRIPSDHFVPARWPKRPPALHCGQ